MIVQVISAFFAILAFSVVNNVPKIWSGSIRC